MRATKNAADKPRRILPPHRRIFSTGHSCESRNPASFFVREIPQKARHWIPAFAGMTREGDAEFSARCARIKNTPFPRKRESLSPKGETRRPPYFPPHRQIPYWSFRRKPESSVFFIRETPQKARRWIPAFAGMTREELQISHGGKSELWHCRRNRPFPAIGIRRTDGESSGLRGGFLPDSANSLFRFPFVRFPILQNGNANGKPATTSKRRCRNSPKATNRNPRFRPMHFRRMSPSKNPPHNCRRWNNENRPCRRWRFLSGSPIQMPAVFMKIHASARIERIAAFGQRISDIRRKGESVGVAVPQKVRRQNDSENAAVSDECVFRRKALVVAFLRCGGGLRLRRWRAWRRRTLIRPSSFRRRCIRTLVVDDLRRFHRLQLVGVCTMSQFANASPWFCRR